MGEVYEAVRSDGELAAVKLLDARAPDRARRVERFHREMAIVARLSSPHLVQVYELSSPDAAMPYVAMERLHGTALASRLRLEVRIPSDEVAMMLYQVACGLDVARRSGLVHRDLKPQNLFFHAGTTWKILDLGVSTLIGSGSTAAGDGVVGTAQYMAPEQVQGGEVGHRADVYALGAVAYRCLTGRALFHARDFAELAYQIAHTPPPRPSTISQVAPVIEDVLAIALAKDPRRRFPSARGFAQAFICARRGTPVPIEIPPDAWR
jgi:serine/threonine-protein kinase